MGVKNFWLKSLYFTVDYDILYLVELAEFLQNKLNFRIVSWLDLTFWTEREYKIRRLQQLKFKI